MTKEVRDYCVQKVNEMINAFSCSQEAKAAGEAWLAALDTDKEAEQTKALIAELEGDIMPIDMLISFAGSQAGVQVFGEEGAKKAHDHAVEIKAAGAVYCDCPACVAVGEILAKKDELLQG